MHVGVEMPGIHEIRLAVTAVRRAEAGGLRRGKGEIDVMGQGERGGYAGRLVDATLERNLDGP